MKTTAKHPDPVSRTIQSKPKASNQAPIHQILQRYQTQTIQRQNLDFDDDELLQGKFDDTTQLMELDEDELLQGKFSDIAQREAFDEDELLQGKFGVIQRAELDDEELLQGKFDTAQREAPSLSERAEGEAANRTGLPDNLKTGVENLSGYSMDDVRVHYNSPKPAQLQALAYTQGTDIHVAPGQEKYLPHEAWHVVQQKQGRVQPTMQLQGVNVNDNEGLEREADVIASKLYKSNKSIIPEYKNVPASRVIQRYVRIPNNGGDYIQANPGINQHPMIMVKENEAGTIYLRQGTPVMQDLNRLGINRQVANVPDPRNAVAPFPAAPLQNFTQLRQGRITIGGLQQPLRRHRDRGRALGHLQRQLRFLNRLNGFVQPIINELQAGAGVIAVAGMQTQAQVNLTAIAGDIRALLDQKTGNLDGWFHKTRRRVIGALGMDIINAAFALYEIASEQINQPAAPNPLPQNPLAAHYTTVVDKVQVINAIRSDVLLRIDQVNREIETVDYEPVLRTGCDVSAIDRSQYMHLNRERQYAGFQKGSFQNEIGWAYHYSNQVNVDNLTTDTLFIEDAVGKSSDAEEMANSHWFARLYGNQQFLAGSPPGVVPLVPIIGNLPAPVPFVPANNFNNLAQGVKNAFFNKRGLAIGDSWTIWYGDDRIPNALNHGRLIISVDNNFNFEYLFQPQPNQTLTPSMQDFMIQTASNVIDGMLIEEFAHRGYSRRMGLDAAPTTQNIYNQMRNQFVRGLNGRYKLEDFR